MVQSEGQVGTRDEAHHLVGSTTAASTLDKILGSWFSREHDYARKEIFGSLKT